MKRVVVLVSIVALCLPLSSNAQTPTVHPNEVFVRFEAPQATYDFGHAIVFRGGLERTTVDTSDECVNFREVAITRVVRGETGSQTVTATVTNENGVFKEVIAADAGSSFAAVATATASCPEATSTSAEIRVRPGLRLTQDAMRFEAQGSAFRAHARPCDLLRGTAIILRRFNGHHFVTASRPRVLRTTCEPVFERRLREDTVFKIVWRKQHPAFEKAESPLIVVPAFFR